MKAHQICKTCNFFHSLGDERQGICKRYPVQLVWGKTFELGVPLESEVQLIRGVPPGDWCGEWKKAK